MFPSGPAGYWVLTLVSSDGLQACAGALHASLQGSFDCSVLTLVSSCELQAHAGAIHDSLQGSVGF